MGLHKIHKILSDGTDFESVCKRVVGFFEKTMLLQYDTVEVNDTLSFSANDPDFWPEVEKGIAANRSVLNENIKELQSVGCHTVQDIASLPLGYPSKVLHIIAHLADGFVGIDSTFFNLQEDSHWLSDSLAQKIKDNPQGYWLLHVEAGFSSPGEASLIHRLKSGA